LGKKGIRWKQQSTVSWKEQGATIEQIQKDHEECNKRSKWSNWRDTDTCMKEKGYKWG
jgi:hypothetical protein